MPDAKQQCKSANNNYNEISMARHYYMVHCMPFTHSAPRNATTQQMIQ